MIQIEKNIPLPVKKGNKNVTNGTENHEAAQGDAETNGSSIKRLPTIAAEQASTVLDDESSLAGRYTIQSDIPIPDSLRYQFGIMEVTHSFGEKYESEDEKKEIGDRYEKAADSFQKNNESATDWEFGIGIDEIKREVRLWRLE